MAKANKSSTSPDPAESTTTPKCPITREQFREKAPASLTLMLPDGQTVLCEKKEFSTGSFGYYPLNKPVLTVDGLPARLYFGTVVVIGSKDLPK